MQSSLFDDLGQRVDEKRVLILGVGNRLRGDDAVGSLLVERLHNRVSALLMDVSDVPENYLGPVESANVDIVLVIDAADFGGKPGDVSLIDVEDLKEVNASTHNASLTLLFRAIPLESRPEALLVGIQPGSTESGSGLSEAVNGAMIELEKVFIDLFGK